MLYRGRFEMSAGVQPLGCVRQVKAWTPTTGRAIERRFAASRGLRLSERPTRRSLTLERASVRFVACNNVLGGGAAGMDFLTGMAYWGILVLALVNALIVWRMKVDIGKEGED